MFVNSSRDEHELCLLCQIQSIWQYLQNDKSGIIERRVPAVNFLLGVAVFFARDGHDGEVVFFDDTRSN